MKIDNAPEMNTKFICKLNGTDGVNYNDVKVGYKPGPIKELKCISNNWEDLNCTFQSMHNPIPVQSYKLTFRIYKDYGMYYNCDVVPLYVNFQYGCYLNLSTHYKQFHKNYYFTLETVNQFGKYEQNFKINHYENIVLSPPIKLTTANITNSSVLLEWEKETRLNSFPEGIVWDMMLISECEGWKKINLSNHEIYQVNNTTNTAYRLWLNDLNFAHTWYDIRLRMQTEEANARYASDDTRWSKWTNVTFQTKQRHPDNPPDIDIASFNVHTNDDVYIYWKELPKCRQNGGNFTYIVKSGNLKNELPSEQSSCNAIYRKEKIDLNTEQTFKIWSKNIMGLSERHSDLKIPAKRKRFGEPQDIKKFVVNLEYQITWSPPVIEDDRDPLTSYTVFWCNSKSELPNDCESSIDFVHLSPANTSYSMRTNKTVNFAIAANSRTSTSGMVWASCTAANTYAIGKIRTFWVPRSGLGSTSVELQWKVECADSSIAKGYSIE